MIRAAKSDKSKDETAILVRTRMTEIGILLYPGARMASVLGLTDMFEVANRISRESAGSKARQLRISHWRSDNRSHELTRVFDTHETPPKSLACLIFPPTLDIDPSSDVTTGLLKWAELQHKAGTVLGSICGGAFLLAHTKLLNGRTATTHWAYAALLAERFPAITVDADRLLIDHGDVFTAGGLMAWLDVGLKLVDRYLSPTVMLATAKFFLVDPAGKQQRFYSTFAPSMLHGDQPIVNVQRALQAESENPFTVERMAKTAKLGQRTFLRRFENATGLTPTEYVHHLKVGRARELLEFSNLTLSEISFRLGYSETSFLRKLFYRLIGLSPSDYRRRFGVAGGRGKTVLSGQQESAI